MIADDLVLDGPSVEVKALHNAYQSLAWLEEACRQIEKIETSKERWRGVAAKQLLLWAMDGLGDVIRALGGE